MSKPPNPPSKICRPLSILIMHEARLHACSHVHKVVHRGGDGHNYPGTCVCTRASQDVTANHVTTALAKLANNVAA